MTVLRTVAPDLNWRPVRPYWEAAARGELCLPRCARCARFQWYPRLLCPACLSPDFDWTVVAPRGEVYSHTTVRRPFLPGAKDAVPFTVVQLQLDEVPGVIVLTGLADEVEPGSITIGQPMTVRFEPATDGVRLPVAYPR